MFSATQLSDLPSQDLPKPTTTFTESTKGSSLAEGSKFGLKEESSASRRRRRSSLVKAVGDMAAAAGRRGSVVAAANAVAKLPGNVSRGTSNFLDDIVLGVDEMNKTPQEIALQKTMEYMQSDEAKALARMEVVRRLNERRASRAAEAAAKTEMVGQDGPEA